MDSASHLALEMSVKNESDERMMPKNGIDSPAVDDANSGGNIRGNGPLKKGPWTSAEDAILAEYVTKHGEGNWNAVQKHSGLARCGKSCRLRWANHLRPNLRKGAFSPEEERLIIELHAKMGNKWARMAAELPGRTDNEIKNYWNTRIKRRQRAGLPIYPPDICLKASNKNQQGDDLSAFSSGDAHYPDFMPVNNLPIPEFRGLESNQQLYPPTRLDDIPASCLLGQGFQSSYPNKYLPSTVHPSKLLQGSEPSFRCLSTAMSYNIPGGNQFQNDGSVQIAQSLIYPSAYDYNSTCDHASSLTVLPGSHAVLNGNPSSSEPAWAMKVELPSLQTQLGNWGSPSSPLPSLESVDTLIQTPPTENTLSYNLSPQNSGLLDAILYESQSMKNSKNRSSRQTSQTADMVDIVDALSQDLYETEWEAYGQPTSPLGYSSSSVFSEGTPISGNSFDEPETIATLLGYNFKETAATLIPTQYTNTAGTKEHMVFTRPDLLLASDCYGPIKDQNKVHAFGR